MKVNPERKEFIKFARDVKAYYTKHQTYNGDILSKHQIRERRNRYAKVK